MLNALNPRVKLHEKLITDYGAHDFFAVSSIVSISEIPKPTFEEYIQIDNFSIMSDLKRLGYSNFIFDITSPEEFKKVREETDKECPIIYRLPLLDFSGWTEELLPELNEEDVMITRISQLTYKDRYNFKRMFADYTLNVWNSEALNILKNFGVSMFTAHPEISFSDSENISNKVGIPLEIIYVGKIPLGYTRACFGELNLCDKHCGKSRFELENVSKKYNVQILCTNKLGYRTITSSAIDVAYIKEGVFKKRFLFSQMSPAKIKSILSKNIAANMSIRSVYGRSVL